MYKAVASLLIIFFAYSNGRILHDIESEIMERSVLHEFDKIGGERHVRMRRGLKPMYPGTKWCGMGNSAKNYYDLGTKWDVDMCCRAHDYCPDFIPGFSSKYGLTNYMFYTSLNCECEEQFYHCLTSTRTLTADKIKFIYFDISWNRCFRKEYPTVRCKRRGGVTKIACEEFEYDTTREKKYQWFFVNNHIIN